MIYKKEITVTTSGMVVAKVIDDTGECKGLEFFTSMFFTNAGTEKSFKKAHRWADARIKLCEQYEARI